MTAVIAAFEVLKMRYLCFLTLLLVTNAWGAVPVGYWGFDGNLNALSKNVYNPTVVSRIDFSCGTLGRALDLSGPGDNAVVIKGTENLTSSEEALTVSCWFKGALSDNPGWSPIVSKAGEGKAGWQIRLYDHEGLATFTVRGPESGYNCSGGTKVADGKWHHIAGVYDGRTICLYVDGKLEQALDTEGRRDDSQCPIVFGAKITASDGPAHVFTKGMIDEVKIFDEALDYDEIKLLADYNQALGLSFMDKYKKLGVYPIQLHRGGGLAVPENTLETFKWAWQQNVIPEADIRTTADDVIVCIHDGDTKRLAPSAPMNLRNKTISEMTLAEVKALDVGEFRGRPDEKIPTLDEVFEAMSKDNRRFIFLDYKSISLERLAEMVAKYGIESQVIFTSRCHNLLCDWKELVPSSQTMMWIGGSEAVISKKMDHLRRENFQGVTIIQFHYHPGEDGYSLSDDFILKAQKELNERGIIFQVLPWLIKDPEVFSKLMDLGIVSFATDYPEALMPVYMEKQK